LLSIIQAAGWPIWPLVACSILALALIIERFVSLKTARIAPPKLLDEALAVSRKACRLPTWSTSSSRIRPLARCWPADFGR
jgi:biopolymer transport protein ExbB